MSRLIVYERQGIWAAALRAEMGDRAGELRQTRGRDDCWQELRAAPTSLVIFELDPRRGGPKSLGSFAAAGLGVSPRGGNRRRPARQRALGAGGARAGGDLVHRIASTAGGVASVDEAIFRRAAPRPGRARLREQIAARDSLGERQMPGITTITR